MTFNTGETTESLKQDYNPEGSTLRKVQLRMLDMLLYLHSVCEKINVQYRIDGGTVLGAIRHGGFIPWDDDIDIVLNRHDWKKLCKYLEKNPHEQYKLQTHSTDSGHYCEWAKLRDTRSVYSLPGTKSDLNELRGAQIDIFVYEKSTSTLFMKWARRLEGINTDHFIGRNKTAAHLMYLFNNKVAYPVFRLFAHVFCRGDYYTHSYGTFWSFKFPSNVLLPHKLISFEGHQVWGPSDPIKLCEIIYGKNWNMLPTRDKRATHTEDIKIWD